MSRGVQRFPASEAQWQPGQNALEQQLARMQSMLTAALAVAVTALAIAIVGMVVAWVVFARKNTSTTTTTVINNTIGANWTNTPGVVVAGGGAEGDVTVLVSASGPHRDIFMLGTLLMLPGPTGLAISLNGIIAPKDLPFFDPLINDVSNYPTCTLGQAATPLTLAAIFYLFPTGDGLIYLLWVNNITSVGPPTLGLIEGVSTYPSGPAIDPNLECQTLVLQCTLSWQTQDAAIASSSIASADTVRASNLAKFRANPPAMWSKYFGPGASSNKVPTASC